MCALARKNHTEDAMMKKLLACALALLLALPAGALAEAIALNLAEEDALVTPEGEVLVPPQDYMEIYAIGGGFYALGVYETGDPHLPPQVLPCSKRGWRFLLYRH